MRFCCCCAVLCVCPQQYQQQYSTQTHTSSQSKMYNIQYTQPFDWYWFGLPCPFLQLHMYSLFGHLYFVSPICLFRVPMGWCVCDSVKVGQQSEYTLTHNCCLMYTSQYNKYCCFFILYVFLSFFRGWLVCCLCVCLSCLVRSAQPIPSCDVVRCSRCFGCVCVCRRVNGI